MPSFDERLTLKTNGQDRITLDPDRQTIQIQRPDGTVFIELGRHGNLVIGGGGLDGDLIVRRHDGKQTVHLDGDAANLWVGGNGQDGDVIVFPSRATDANDASQATIWLNGQEGNLMLGGNGTDGDIALFPRGATISQDSFAEATILLDGERGDILLRNADCAEEFDVTEDAEPGTVLVLDEGERLRPSARPYDRRVAGIAAGAGDYRPGLVLDRRDTGRRRLPVALMGKAFCQVDAGFGAVEAGDLLTTSETPGAAMRADDPARAFGAVIGKALRPLRRGCGLVPVLVSLQ